MTNNLNKIVVTAHWMSKDETFGTHLQMECGRATPAQVGAAMHALHVQLIMSIEQMRGELAKVSPAHVASSNKGLCAEQKPRLKGFDSAIRDLGDGD